MFLIVCSSWLITVQSVHTHNPEGDKEAEKGEVDGGKQRIYLPVWEKKRRLLHYSGCALAFHLRAPHNQEEEVGVPGRSSKVTSMILGCRHLIEK